MKLTPEELEWPEVKRALKFLKEARIHDRALLYWRYTETPTSSATNPHLILYVAVEIRRRVSWHSAGAFTEVVKTADFAADDLETGPWPDLTLKQSTLRINLRDPMVAELRQVIARAGIESYELVQNEDGPALLIRPPVYYAIESKTCPFPISEILEVPGTVILNEEHVGPRWSSYFFIRNLRSRLTEAERAFISQHLATCAFCAHTAWLAVRERNQNFPIGASVATDTTRYHIIRDSQGTGMGPTTLSPSVGIAAGALNDDD